MNTTRPVRDKQDMNDMLQEIGGQRQRRKGVCQE